VLYISMQLGVLGAIPWQQIVPLADGSLPPLGQHVASAVVEQSFGAIAAGIVTILILVTAFASVYGNLLGYTRVPYAAAADGVFLRPFAHLNRAHRFPDVALVVMGLLALPACLLPLDAVIAALTTGIILVQSIAQIVGLFVIRRRGITAPYRMWLFPVPALIALAGWSFLFVSAGFWPIVFGVVSVLAGTAVFGARAASRKEWPFARTTP
jgi:amino acid transporter